MQGHRQHGGRGGDMGGEGTRGSQGEQRAERRGSQAGGNSGTRVTAPLGDSAASVPAAGGRAPPGGHGSAPARWGHGASRSPRGAGSPGCLWAHGASVTPHLPALTGLSRQRGGDRRPELSPALTRSLMTGQHTAPSEAAASSRHKPEPGGSYRAGGRCHHHTAAAHGTPHSASCGCCTPKDTQQPRLSSPTKVAAPRPQT